MKSILLGFITIALVCQGFLLLADPVPKEEKIHRFLLVTGCGRSGTVYMTKFLLASGLKVGHEHHMEDDGIVSWLMASNTSWAPWGPSPQGYTFEHVFHQVRHPLRVIQSYYNSPTGAGWDWIGRSIPIKPSESKLLKCAKFWYYWNLLAESKAEWTYKLEDFDTLYLEFGQRLGLELDKAILDSISKEINTKVKPDSTIITWKMLKEELPPKFYIKFIELALRYGYSIEDDSD